MMYPSLSKSYLFSEKLVGKYLQVESQLELCVEVAVENFEKSMYELL